VLSRKLIAEAAIYSISNGSVILKEFTSIGQQDEERSWFSGGNCRLNHLTQAEAQRKKNIGSFLVIWWQSWAVRGTAGYRSVLRSLICINWDEHAQASSKL